MGEVDVLEAEAMTLRRDFVAILMRIWRQRIHRHMLSSLCATRVSHEPYLHDSRKMERQLLLYWESPSEP